MSNIIVEHSKIYKSYFNAPYIIADSSTGGNKASKSGSADNIGFIEKYRGIDVMTPVTLCTASRYLDRRQGTIPQRSDRVPHRDVEKH